MTNEISEIKNEIKKLKLKNNSQLNLVWLRFKRNRLSLVGLIIILIIIATAILAPFLTPYDPYRIDMKNTLSAPSYSNLLGTDALGRDVLTRLIYGSRIAMLIGILIVLFEGLIGITFGIISGFFGGLLDKTIMRLVEIFQSFPVIVLAIAIAGILGPGLFNVVIAIGVVGWTTYTRMVRGKVLVIKESEYVENARAIGESTFSIIMRYVIPNAIPTAIVMVCLMMPTALIASATLSFLGLGVEPPLADWGSIISSGRNYMLEAPWISTSAGFFIMFTVLGFNFIGDGLRDALDPTIKRD